MLLSCTKIGSHLYILTAIDSLCCADKRLQFVRPWFQLRREDVWPRDLKAPWKSHLTVVQTVIILIIIIVVMIIVPST